MDDDKTKLAVGIDIVPEDARARGYGRNAFVCWIGYLFNKTKANAVYTQTWSGNYPMIALAGSVGFAEVRRLKGLREVNGKKFDALTFKILKEEFERSF
jgi:RimJ/RimL family protein N-acetyltransferase